MDVKTFGIVFATVFLAEMGDKTQLATMLFAARNGHNLLSVFLAAALALFAATAIGVLAGAALSSIVDLRLLSYIAGIGFVAVGCWTIWQAG